MKNSSAKLDQALAQINKLGLDGLIIYSDGICSMLRPSYFHYFAELKPMGPNNALILSKRGYAVLLVEPQWDLKRASGLTWVKDLRGTSNFIFDLVKVIRDLDIKGVVGVSGGNEMTEPVRRATQAQAEIQAADKVIEEIARNKSDKELEIIRKTARIADLGFLAFLKYARVGIREYELSAEVEYAMRSAGADDNFNLFSSGRHSHAMHPPTDKRLAVGDIVLGEITPVCEGQFIQLCRTVVLGQPGETLAQKYEMLLLSLQEALKPVRVGSPAALISRNMNKVISDAGYAKYCYPPYMRARAHGLAVGNLAPGGAVDDNTESFLEDRQVIIVHSNQYLPETGYLSCGETVLVMDSGFERLSTTETKLYIKED
jgi:Xaa-Pro dipeptidase